MNIPENTVICLMGPTASGKTAIALELVKRVNFEIISVDSAQVYKYMDIGTAKPDSDTLKIAPHRLIDFLDPAISYSVAEFLSDVKREIKDIKTNGNIPLLVGGTMMYFNALQKGLAKLPDADESIRDELKSKARQHGLKALHEELSIVDKVSANKINPNDSQRIFRALEVYKISDKPMSKLQTETANSYDYNYINFALMPDNRAALHQRIERRFDKMLDQGLVSEVKKLYKRGDLQPGMPSMRSVGYRQVWQHLKGELDFSQMRERGIIATRQLAKRQITWLRSWDDLWLITNANEITDKINA